MSSGDKWNIRDVVRHLALSLGRRAPPDPDPLYRQHKVFMKRIRSRKSLRVDSDNGIITFTHVGGIGVTEERVRRKSGG